MWERDGEGLVGKRRDNERERGQGEWWGVKEGVGERERERGMWERGEL